MYAKLKRRYDQQLIVKIEPLLTRETNKMLFENHNFLGCEIQQEFCDFLKKLIFKSLCTERLYFPVIRQ